MKTEELTNKALTLVDKILDAANAGIEQAPTVIQDLAREYVIYFEIDNISGIAFAITSMAICGWILNYCWKSDDEMIKTMGCTFSCFGFILSLVFFFNTFTSSIQALVTPKAFLIQKIRGDK